MSTEKQNDNIIIDNEVLDHYVVNNPLLPPLPPFTNNIHDNDNNKGTSTTTTTIAAAAAAAAAATVANTDNNIINDSNITNHNPISNVVTTSPSTTQQRKRRKNLQNNNNNNDKEPSASTTNKINNDCNNNKRKKSIKKSPYQVKYERLKFVITKQGGTSHVPIHPIRNDATRSQYTFLEEDNNNNDKNHTHSLTQDMVNQFRTVIVDDDRKGYVERNKRLLLGCLFDFHLQQGPDYANWIVLKFDSIQKRFNKIPHREAPRRYNILFSFTFVIYTYDSWMRYTNADAKRIKSNTPKNSEQKLGDKCLKNHQDKLDMITKLAKFWKTTLTKYTLEQLKLDEEFSHPGTIALLQDFKTKIENVSLPAGITPFVFNWE